MGAATSYNSFVSKYHPWFVEMGYPQLDVRFIHSYDPKFPKVWGHETGEWAIIEMLNSPHIPHLTQWRDVMTGLRHMEINKGTLKWLAESIDIKKQAIWERELNKSLAVEAEHEAVRKHRDETVDRITAAYTKNEAVMERIAKNGLWEMDPKAIMRHIPNSRF